VLHKCPVRFFGGSTTSVEPQLRSNFNKSGAVRNRLYVSGAAAAQPLYSVPSGNSAGKTWLIPQKSGEISSRNDCVMSVDGGGLAVGGVTTTGTASILIDFAPATGGLITSGSGSASVSITGNATMVASIQGTGSATISITTNAPVLGAQAYLAGSATFSLSGSLTPYAIGRMSGSTLDQGTLTSESVASAVWSRAIEAGYTAEQLMRIISAHAAGSATGLEGANPQFYGVDGTTLRIDGAYSGGSRTIDALNGA
jgi:hypothetical protein